MNIFHKLTGKKMTLYSEKTPYEIINILKNITNEDVDNKYCFKGTIENYNFTILEKSWTKSDFSAKIYGRIFEKENNGSTIRIIVSPPLLTLSTMLLFFFILIFLNNFGILDTIYESNNFFKIFFFILFIFINICFVLFYNYERKQTLQKLFFLLKAKE